MIIQCDFDGTVTTNNVSLLLRERFAVGDWQKIESDDLRGQLAVEVSNIRQYALIKESREKLQDVMSEFGYTIYTALVNDIRPDAKVAEAMNEINAQQRYQVAAEHKGEIRYHQDWQTKAGYLWQCPAFVLGIEYHDGVLQNC